MSDCVHILRVSRIDCYFLCLFLNTRFAKEYLRACCRGVGSQYITKADLLSMPIFPVRGQIMRHLSARLKKLVKQADFALADCTRLSDELQMLIESKGLCQARLAGVGGSI